MKSGYITAEGQLTEKALNALEVNKKLKEEWVVNLKRMSESPRIIHLNLDQAKK